MGDRSARVEADGGLTLPEEVRHYLLLEEGDLVEFVIADGQVVMRRASGCGFSQGSSEVVGQPSYLRLEGVLADAGGRRLSVREMDEALAVHVREDDERIRGGRTSRERES